MTEPGAMPLIISVVMMTGAVLPCTCAVVMTTSLAATVLAISSCCFLMVSSESCLA